MSLGQLVSSPTFMEDTIVAKSSSQKRSNLTLSHSLKCSDCKSSTAIISSGFNAINHRGLRRIASDNSFLTRAAPTKSYDTTWISTSFGDYNNDKELSLTTNVQQTVNVRLKQHNNFFNGQTYKLDPGLRYSSYREKSNTAVMKNISSSGPETTERVTNSRLEKSHTYNAALHSGELLLDFPSNDYSSQSYTVKRSDKIREPSDHPSLHHSASMPGLIGSSMKESRSDFASAKFESKSRPSFLFFRKNNKTSDGRSPSPSVKSNHKNIKRHHGNLNSTPQSQTISQRTTSPTSRGRRSAGQSPVSIRFYINSVSSNVPCSPSSPPSMCSQSETRSSSPTSTDKFPLYTKRSRSKRGRESRRTISEHPHADDRLKLEDLPPHPSLFKHLLGKTSSYPCASVITPSSIKINTISNNTAGHRFEAMYAIRRNSLPESHANLKMADQFSKRHNSPKDFKIDSSQNLRKNSLESSNKSTSGKDFQPEMTCSSHCQKPRSPVRSESVSILGDNFYLSGTDTMVISDAEDFEYRPTDMTGPLHVSLCGCGFLGMYHLGVISCLTQRSPSLLERLEKVAGASAGAIMAALLISCRDKIERQIEADKLQGEKEKILLLKDRLLLAKEAAQAEERRMTAEKEKLIIAKEAAEAEEERLNAKRANQLAMLEKTTE